MKRKIISLLLCMVITANLIVFIPSTAEAFDYSIYNSLCPITMYPCTSDSTFPSYTTVECTTKKGTIYKSDRCTISKFYKNSDDKDVCKVTYPISGGTKTAYAKTLRFIYDKSFKPIKTTITAKTNVSAYPGSTPLSGWYTSANQTIYILGRSGSNSQIAYSVSGGHKIAWIKNYTVKYNANGGSSAPGSQIKEQNVNLTLTSSKPTRTGYTFQSWNTAKDGSGTKYTAGGAYKNNAGTTLYAQWKKTPCTLTVKSADANLGTVSGGGTYDYGSKVTIKATPKTGCSFVKWNDGNTSASRQVTVTGNTTYTATFKKNTYTISVASTDSNMGTVSGGKTSDYGTTITITATPKTGYHFVKWDDGNTDASRKITVTGNKTYKATFAKNEYTITARSDNQEMGTVSGGNKYLYLDVATLKAESNQGYKFTKWNDGDTSALRRVTVKENATYIAYFEPDPNTCIHDFGNWITDSESTCTEPGLKHRTCSKCGFIDQDSIKIIPHKYTDDWIIDTLPSCEENGKKHRVCLICKTETETEEIPMLGHDYSVIKTTKEPTCTETGLQEVYCLRCNAKDETKTTELPAKGHSYPDAWEIEQEANCTEDGIKSKTCSICGNKWTDIIEATGHTFVDSRHEPENGAAGYIDHRCVKCAYTEKEYFYNEVYEGVLAVETHEYASVGETVSVPITIADNPGFTGFDIALEYDSDIITPQIITNGEPGVTGDLYAEAADMLSGGRFQTKIISLSEGGSNSKKAINIQWYGASTVDLNGEMFKVKFNVKNDTVSKSSDLILSCNKMTNTNMEKIVPTINNGSITVDSSELKLKKGDIYTDGLIDVMDGVRLAQHLVGFLTNPLTSVQLEAADVYVDGKVNTKDSVRLAQMIMGWNSSNANVSSAAVSDIPVEITVGSSAGEIGQYVDIPIIIKNNTGIAGFNFTIDYDSNYVLPTAIEGSEIIGGDITSNITNANGTNQPDHLSFQWSDSDNIVANGALCTVKFKVVDAINEGQNIPLHISCTNNDYVCCVQNDSINEVNTVMNDGVITIGNVADEYTYSIDNVTMLENGAEEIETIPVNGDFNLDIDIHKNDDSVSNGEIIVAAYDDNNGIISYNTKPIDSQVLAEGAYIHINRCETEIESIKIFIWTSLNDIEPLSKEYYINRGEKNI